MLMRPLGQRDRRYDIEPIFRTCIREYLTDSPKGEKIHPGNVTFSTSIFNFLSTFRPFFDTENDIWRRAEEGKQSFNDAQRLSASETDLSRAKRATTTIFSTAPKCPKWLYFCSRGVVRAGGHGRKGREKEVEEEKEEKRKKKKKETRRRKEELGYLISKRSRYDSNGDDFWLASKKG